MKRHSKNELIRLLALRLLNCPSEISTRAITQGSCTLFLAKQDSDFKDFLTVYSDQIEYLEKIRFTNNAFVALENWQELSEKAKDKAKKLKAIENQLKPFYLTGQIFQQRFDSAFYDDPRQNESDLVLRSELAKFYFHLDNFELWAKSVSFPFVGKTGNEELSRALALTYPRQVCRMDKFLTILFQIFQE